MANKSAGPVLAEDFAQVASALGDRLDRLAGTRLLLTGASGLLGGYMARSLLWFNDEVLSSPCQLIALARRPVRSDSLLGQVGERSDLKILTQNVNDPIEIDGQLDFIVHAASRASPRDYREDPLDTIDANVAATRSLLDMARAQDVKGFLYLSSGEIYGDVPAEGQPIREDYPGSVSPISPRACYTESKRLGETLTVTFQREFDVPANIVRPFQVYGPGLRLDDGRVVADFLRSRIRNEPIHLLSDGSAVRAFCYAADGIAGFWSALLADEFGKAINIGDDREPVSMLELAETVSGLEEPHFEVTRETVDIPEYLRGNPSRSWPDVGEARRVLGYEPRTDLEEGLRRTLRWLRDQQND